MAEALAIAGSIFTIVQIAGAATRLSRSLYATARKAGSAKEDIQKFAMDTSAFASIIRVAHNSIRGHCQKESNSAVLRYIREHDVLGQLVEQATRIRKHIEAVRPQIQDLRGRLTVVNHLRWIVFNRPDVKALHPEMECVKTNLLVVMHILALELAQQRQQEHQSDETRREIKSLKRQIQVHIQTIFILQEQRSASAPQQYHSSSSRLPSEQSSLLQLAESMVETGEVPDQDVDFYLSDSSSMSSSWVTTSPSVELHRERGQASSCLRIPPINSRSIGSLSSQESMDIPNGVSKHFRSLQVDLVEPDPPANEPAPPANEPAPLAIEPAPLAIEPAPPATEPAESANSVEVKSNDYLAVRSADSILHLNSNSHVQAETGNIKTPRGRETIVTVIVDSELEANVVSEAFAIENGLEIQDDEDDAGVIVEFQPGVRMRSVGQVVLVWTKDLTHRQPLRVRCWVVPYSGRPVYFGKPFVDKRDYYWGQGQQNH